MTGTFRMIYPESYMGKESQPFVPDMNPWCRGTRYLYEGRVQRRSFAAHSPKNLKEPAHTLAHKNFFPLFSAQQNKGGKEKETKFLSQNFFTPNESYKFHPHTQTLRTRARTSTTRTSHFLFSFHRARKLLLLLRKKR